MYGACGLSLSFNYCQKWTCRPPPQGQTRFLHVVHSCSVAQCQPWFSQGSLDVLVILFGKNICTLDALVRVFGIIWRMNEFIINQLCSRLLMVHSSWLMAQGLGWNSRLFSVAHFRSGPPAEKLNFLISHILETHILCCISACCQQCMWVIF